MNIPKKIDEIVAKRKSQLPKISEMVQHLENVNEAVQHLDKVCNEISSEKSEEWYGAIIKQHPEIAEQLRYINTKAFYDTYNKTQAVLSELQNRFSREHIHISFVGRARQGKSLVMQRISGLTGDVIPSSDGSDCTGAKSVITNSPTTDNVTAEISFYTRSEFRDIINNYLYKIFGHSRYELDSVDAISQLNAEELQKEVELSAEKQAWFSQLEKYIEHGSDVLPFLGQKENVGKDKIEEYVAQYSHEDRNTKYYKYLGVKVANILCKFPCEQCGKIVLVDTIGLGDTAIDIKEKMLETVSRDSDAILMMTRPDSKGQKIEQDDITIVEDIGKKMTPEYTKHMLFWIINKVCDGVGKNVDGIPEILEGLKKMYDFPAAAFLDVDCFDPKKVENELLLPVLEQLSKNLPEMDGILIDNAQKALNELYQEYHAIASRVGQALDVAVEEDVKRNFEDKIRQASSKMTEAVRILYLPGGEYGKIRNTPCEKLKKATEEKLKSVLTSIPTKEEILKLITDGFNKSHAPYTIITDEVRIKTINEFLEINKTLHELTMEMKRHIVKCLAEEGRLGNLVSTSPDNADEWLRELINIGKKPLNFDMIETALQKLLEFDLRMESFLIYRVRANLDKIDTNLTNLPPLPGETADRNLMVEDMEFWLTKNLNDVYNDIRHEMKSLYSYPNDALWAVVKDFYDRIVCTRKNNFDVKDAWRYLYEDNIKDIWKDEHTLYLQSKGVSEQWNKFVDSMHKYDNKDSFQFKEGTR